MKKALAGASSKTIAFLFGVLLLYIPIKIFSRLSPKKEKPFTFTLV
jgi:uncharacterized membrane protein